MRRVILFLFALSAVVSAQAQLMSSGGFSGSVKSGVYNSDGSGLDFSGKISTIESESEAVPTYQDESKSRSFSAIAASVKSKISGDNKAEKTGRESSKFSGSDVNNKIYFAWNFVGFTGDEMDEYDLRREGVSLAFGYSHATNIFKNLLFVDYGVAFSYAELEWEDYDYEYNYDDDYYSALAEVDAMELRVPINLMLNLKLSHKINLRPYAGIAFEYNFLSSCKSPFLIDVHNRRSFQIGTQYGLGINLSKFYLGVERRRLIKGEGDPVTNVKSTSLCVGIAF